jgi:mono/diheme cytochrome c family protein
MRGKIGFLQLFVPCCIFLALILASCSKQPALQDESVSQGELLYTDNCAECHETSHPDLLKQPPNLHGVFAAKVLPSGGPATDEQVRKTIIDGRGTMPAFDQRLTDAEVDDLVKYLHTLK